MLKMKFNNLFCLIFLICSFQSSADNLSDSNQLFEWAEVNYPQFFSPPEKETFQLEFQMQNYLVRYYEDTDTYIGTLGEDVYVYGDFFDGLLQVGRISDYIQVEPSNGIGGIWDYTGTDDARACGEGIFSYNRILTVTVDGNQMNAVSNNGFTITGTINGNTISTSNKYPEDGGITTETGTFIVNGNSFSGNSNWTWTNGSFSCSGTTTHSGTKR